MRRALAAIGSALAVVAATAACSTGDPAGDGGAPAGGTGAPTTAPPGEPAVDLTVGDCFNGLAVGAAERAGVERVVPVPCEEPHDLEVFHGFEFGGTDDPYPGEEPVVRLAEAGCAEAFVHMLGERASLGQVALWPTEASWEAGDRAVLCAAYQIAGGRLTGNLP